MSTLNWKCTIANEDSDRRIQNCLIRLQSGDEIKSTHSDHNGEFEFRDLDSTKNWSAEILCKGFFAYSIPEVIEDNKIKVEKVGLRRISSDVDIVKGKIFVTRVSIILFVMATLYVVLHYSLKSANEPLNYTLASELTDWDNTLDKVSKNEINSFIEMKKSLNDILTKEAVDLESVQSKISIFESLRNTNFKDADKTISEIHNSDDYKELSIILNNEIDGLRKKRAILIELYNTSDSLVDKTIHDYERVRSNEKKAIDGFLESYSSTY